MSKLIGGIEAGGTKFVCAVGRGPDDLRDEVRFPTTTPAETLGKAIAYFKEMSAKHGSLSALGIAAFGPLDPNPGSPTFGYITTTPKPHWGNVDVVGTMQKEFDVPVGFDTDVNGAAWAEHLWGVAQDVDNLIYLTIGTGVGGGVIANGELVHGLIHPELGHISLPHDWEKDPYPGRCPYHGDCLEGMAAGPAIGDRWQKPAYELPADHPAWELEAHYLALALRTFICTLSPERIVLGGGVMEQPQLFPLVREKTQAYLHGYVQAPAILDDMDSYIVPPGLGNKAGVLGSFALGISASTP
ncbi:MAG: fructokinase [Chloroflexi bacterium]|nr:MAG: fructokinase [Chloroflexota bacterium]